MYYLCPPTQTFLRRATQMNLQSSNTGMLRWTLKWVPPGCSEHLPQSSQRHLTLPPKTAATCNTRTIKAMSQLKRGLAYLTNIWKKRKFFHPRPSFKHTPRFYFFKQGREAATYEIRAQATIKPTHPAPVTPLSNLNQQTEQQLQSTVIFDHGSLSIRTPCTNASASN